MSDAEFPQSSDEALERFEKAWVSGKSPDIAEFVRLPVSLHEQLSLLADLIELDLEYRWKQFSNTSSTVGSNNSLHSYATFTNYASRFEGLSDDDAIAERLLIHEYNVRQRWGDCVGMQSLLLQSSDCISDTVVQKLTQQFLAETESAQYETNVSREASVQIGPYKILQKIAEGGMGAVFMVEQESPVRRWVALKLIKAGADSAQIIARFEAERQALAMMDHPNIARIFDGGTTDEGSPYFVMELVKGIPLTDYCDNNRLSIRERLELFMSICNAVQHAHLKGIIHRDLKPSNVLVALHDGVPVPKVIDFGLAKAMDHQTKLTEKTMFTEFGQVVGTLQYMSPEQAEMNQLDVDTRTDVYSLGVMLYELLTGSTPLERATLGQHALLAVLALIRDQEPPRPSTRLSDSGDAITGVSEQRKIEPSRLQQILRGELDWIVMRSLEKDRTRRYETASAFADDVKRYLNDDQVMARPPSLVYRMQKTVRRHKASIVTLGLVFGLLVAGLTGTVAMWMKAEEETVRANAQTTLAMSESKRAAEEARKSREAEELERLARLDVEKERDKVATERDRAKAAEKRAADESVRAREAEEKERLVRIDVETERDNADRQRQKAVEAKQETEATLSKANYLLANARWDANRAADANDLLDKVPPKHRKLEWYLSKRKFKGSDFICYGHTREVTDVDCSPMGSEIVSASADGTVRIWDAINGDELKTLVSSGTIEWTAVSYSPDGKRIAAGNSKGTIHVWDASNGGRIRTLKFGYKVNDVSFSPDGRIIAAGGRDTAGSAGLLDIFFRPMFAPGERGRVCMWQADTGESLTRTILRNYEVTALAFSPDSSLIAFGDSYGGLFWWDVKSKKVRSNDNGHEEQGVTSVCFSPDGKRLVTGWLQSLFWEAGSAIVWDVATGKHLVELKANARDVSSVTVSPDGLVIATGHSDGNIRIWKQDTGRLLHTFSGHAGDVTSLRFTPNAMRLVSAGSDKTIRTWNMFDVTGHSRPNPVVEEAELLSCSNNGLLAAMYQNEELSVWELPTRRRVFSTQTQRASAAAFSHDGKLLGVANAKGIEVLDARDGTVITALKWLNGDIVWMGFSSDGRRLCAVSEDGIVQTWNVKDGKNDQEIDVDNDVFVAGTNADCTKLFTAGSYLKLRDLKTNETLLEVDPGESIEVSFVVGACISPDGNRIAAGIESMFRVWDATSGKEIWSVSAVESQIISVAYTLDNSRIVTGDLNGIVRVWDAGTGEQLATFAGTSASVGEITICSEGLLVSRSKFLGEVLGEDAVTIDLIAGASRQEATTLRGHVGDIERFSFHEEKALLRTVSDHETLTWDVSADNPVQVSTSVTTGWTEHTSSDGRWLAIPDGNKIRLIDQTFKKHPAERAYCQLKAKPDPVWHRDRAKQAEAEEDWFAATFHSAWEAKIDPTSETALKYLNAAYDRLDANQKNVLPSVVTETLETADGRQVIDSSFDRGDEVN